MCCELPMLVTGLTNLVLWGSVTSASNHDGILCAPITYIKEGDPGEVQCSPEVDFEAVYWYNSTDLRASPMLTLSSTSGEVIRGSGSNAEGYDIGTGGSLLITQANIEQDHRYRVVFAYPGLTDSITQEIEIRVIVYPALGHPLVNVCGTKRVCFARIESKLTLNCTVESSRPEMPITWYRRNGDEEEIIDADYVTKEDGHVFTTVNVFVYQPLLHSSTGVDVFTCRANTIAIEQNETVVLLDSSAWFSKYSEPRYFNRHSEITLECPSNNSDVLIWKKKTTADDFKIIAIDVYGDIMVFEQGMHLNDVGTLSISNVDIPAEGDYVCQYKSSGETRYSAVSVGVYIPPIAPAPIIEGCEGTTVCFLEKKSVGVVTCSLGGMRPAAHLTLEYSGSGLTEFVSYEQSANIVSDEYTYNITAMWYYLLVDDEESSQITVTCYAEFPDSVPVISSATAVIGYPPESKLSGWYIGGCIIAVIIVFGVSILSILLAHRKYKEKSRRKTVKSDTTSEDPKKTEVIIQLGSQS